MRILAIETSCDETALAILDGEGALADARMRVLASTVLSQIELHREYGGVYPNLAKREHAKNLVPLLIETLQQANMYAHEAQEISAELRQEMRDILAREPELFVQCASIATLLKKPDLDAVAVTVGPGLEPALWVGINFARVLSLLWNVPVVAVNHMEGHILSALSDTEGAHFSTENLTLPAVALLVSGGHTELVSIEKFGSYTLLGATKDDAVGEAFDKVARMLGLPYPGGPEISAYAAKAREKDIKLDEPLPRPMQASDDYHFSYSGLKTAVRYRLDAHESVDETMKMAYAREFEEAAIDVLTAKTKRALDAHAPATLIVAGGVAANSYLRARMEELLKAYPDTWLIFPPRPLSTDNAVMIAVAGYLRATDGVFAAPEDLIASGNMALAR